MAKKIKCNVDTCEYNNKKNTCCDLDSVAIPCTCKNDECACNEETICSSFKEKKSKRNRGLPLFLF